MEYYKKVKNILDPDNYFKNSSAKLDPELNKD